ncbi:MAG: aminoglycoside phosphotransferase family protein [Terriglobales bacterium]
MGPVAGPPAAIYIARPGRKQKAVFFFCNSSRPALVAKVPLTAAAASAVMNEVAALQRLSGEHPGISPRPEYTCRERSISVQQYVTGRPAARDICREELGFLARLTRPLDRIPGRTIAEGIAQQAVANGKILDPQMEVMLDTLCEAPDLPLAWTHGDFMPWNLRITSGATIAVDWESASPNGVALHDLLHRLYMDRYLFQRRDLEIARQPAVWELARLTRLTADVVRSCAVSYLAHAWLAALIEGEPSRAKYMAAESQVVAREN